MEAGVQGPSTRDEVRARAAELDRITGGRWLADLVYDSLAPSQLAAVVDSVRTTAQFNALRERAGGKAVLLHLAADAETRRRRFDLRADKFDCRTSLAELEADRFELAAEELSSSADLRVDTSRLAPREVLEKVVPGLRDLGVVGDV